MASGSKSNGRTVGLDDLAGFQPCDSMILFKDVGGWDLLSAPVLSVK